MTNLTDRQQEILDYIKQHIEINKYSPTVREVAAAFNMSIKGAYDHIRALKKKNAITSDTNRSRSIGIVDEESSPTVAVPLLGHIAAGMPLMAEENFDGHIFLPREYTRKGELFALKVQGDSMIDAGILDGDTAVFIHQKTANNGEIVAAMLDESVTLKRFYKEQNRVKLQAENEAYSPIYTQHVTILGKLITILRTYGR